MRNRVAGFLLFEFMMYLMLAMVVVYLASYLAVTTYTQILVCTNRCSLSVATSCALDVLVRDVRQAPADQSLWKSMQDGDYVWRTYQGDVGWQLRKKNLVRTSGIFDSVMHTWKDAAQSVIVDNVVDFTCHCVHKNSLIEYVVCTITTADGKSSMRYVTLYNGMQV